MVGLGYYHTLSKQTQAYIMGTYNNNDDLQYYTTAGGAAVAVEFGFHDLRRYGRPEAQLLTTTKAEISLQRAPKGARFF